MTCATDHETWRPLQASAQWEFAVILSPQPRFLPRFGLWGCPPKLSQLANDSHRSLSPFQLPSPWTAYQKGLATFPIHRGTLKSASTLKITSIISSLSACANQILRKKPQTVVQEKHRQRPQQIGRALLSPVSRTQ